MSSLHSCFLGATVFLEPQAGRHARQLVEVERNDLCPNERSSGEIGVIRYLPLRFCRLLANIVINFQILFSVKRSTFSNTTREIGVVASHDYFIGISGAFFFLHVKLHEIIRVIYKSSDYAQFSSRILIMPITSVDTTGITTITAKLHVLKISYDCIRLTQFLSESPNESRRAQRRTPRVRRGRFSVLLHLCAPRVSKARDKNMSVTMPFIST